MELTLPMLLYRVKTGEFWLEQIAAYASERPARIFGLYPHKGSLRVGADADVVLVDLNRTYAVEVDNLFTQAKDSARGKCFICCHFLVLPPISQTLLPRCG